MLKKMIVLAVVVPFVSGIQTAAWASGTGTDFKPQLEALASDEVSTWISEQSLRDAVIAQNTRNAGLAQADIDAMDQAWRAQIDAGGPLIDEVLANPLSARLKALKDAGKGRFTEIFVTDARGLNVGQSDLTSDYWQGDEAKWQVPHETHGIHMSEVEFDESSQTYQVQLSLPIMQDQTMIGTITVGVDVERLSE